MGLARALQNIIKTQTVKQTICTAWAESWDSWINQGLSGEGRVRKAISPGPDPEHEGYLKSAPDSRLILKHEARSESWIQSYLNYSHKIGTLNCFREFTCYKLLKPAKGHDKHGRQKKENWGALWVRRSTGNSSHNWCFYSFEISGCVPRM